MREIFTHYFDSFTKGYNFAIRYDNQYSLNHNRDQLGGNTKAANWDGL